MPWIGAKYKFMSTFSYRLPNFSSSYALSAPSPSPSTVKLALVSSTISRSGKVESGKTLLEQIRLAKVTMELPDRMATFKSFIKRLKPKRHGGGFEKTFGVREYVVYGGPLSIYIEAPHEIIADISDALKNISYFGTSDSLCICIETSLSDPPWGRCAKPYNVKTMDQKSKEGLIFLLTDLTENASFETVNPFSEVKLRERKHIISLPYLFPMRIVKKESNCVVYELIPS